MILDEFLEFCDDTDVSGGAGTTLVGDVVDMSAVPGDPGNTGYPLWFVVQASADILTGTSTGTISFTLASDAQPAIATNGSATEHFISTDFVTSTGAGNDLDAGELAVCTRLPGGVLSGYERYLGVLVTIATQAVASGAINAFLTLDPSKWVAYADADN